MAIKRTLTTEEFEALDMEDKELYEESGDGYKIVAESAGALRRAKQHEAEATKKAKAELRDARARVKELEAKEVAREEKNTENLKERGDFKAYEERLRAQFQKKLDEKDAAIAERDGKILGSRKYEKALEIAKEISTVPDLLADKIATHLGAEYNSTGGVDLYVKDNDGKKSIDGFEVLTKRFQDDTRYSKIMIATKASGSGTTEVSQQVSGALPAEIGSKAETGVTFNEMTPEQLEKVISANIGG